MHQNEAQFQPLPQMQQNNWSMRRQQFQGGPGYGGDGSFNQGRGWNMGSQGGMMYGGQGQGQGQGQMSNGQSWGRRRQFGRYGGGGNRGQQGGGGNFGGGQMGPNGGGFRPGGFGGNFGGGQRNTFGGGSGNGGNMTNSRPGPPFGQQRQSTTTKSTTSHD